MNNVSFREAVSRANSIFRYRRYLRERRAMHMSLRIALREWCWRFYYEWSRGP
jgi:hypothetical protein